jgi:hypothetical protein
MRFMVHMLGPSSRDGSPGISGPRATRVRSPRLLRRSRSGARATNTVSDPAPPTASEAPARPSVRAWQARQAKG